MKLSVFVYAMFLNFYSFGGNPVVYLLPGQGSDHRVFSHLKIADDFEIRHLDYPLPEVGMSMSEYAKSLLSQIDRTQPFVLIGVSLGGMLSEELNEFCQPEKTIIISSAKSRNELPFRYKFQTAFPIYSFVSAERSTIPSASCRAR